MDTEKIKQMGRDYFTANPKASCNQELDAVFMAVWKKRYDELGNDGTQIIYFEWSCEWKRGFMEAQYAASKEGRAIELLGRVFEWHMKDVRPPVVSEHDSSHYVWEDVAEFLDEVKSKPTA